jgi:hypothetical protein
MPSRGNVEVTTIQKETPLIIDKPCGPDVIDTDGIIFSRDRNGEGSLQDVILAMCTVIASALTEPAGEAPGQIAGIVGGPDL